MILFMGIQGSGKSTFYKQKFEDTHLRLNMDMLRTRHREQILLTACLEGKQPVVIDNTNPTAEDRARYIAPARKARFQVAGYYFQSGAEPCLKRNATRPPKQVVPESAIWGTAAKMERPTFAEGFDRLWYVRIGDEGFIVEPWKEEAAT